MTAQPTTHRATQENGPSVIKGRLIWTSATGITTADPNSYGGCTRKWYYDQVEDRKGPPTAAMLGGTALHGEIERRLLTGAAFQSPLALAGAHFVPQPGGNLHVERPIRFKTSTGVDIYGHVDLYNFRQEYIDSEGALQSDPPWSFEVKDWKTTSDFQYAKTAQELAENIQLVTYAEAGYRLVPDMEHSRLTHVYFRTRGAPAARLVTIRRSREEIGSRWEYAESVVRVMSDAAREPSAETVPGNRRACDAYKGCLHRGICSVYKFNALDNLFNKIAEDHLKEKPVGIIANNPGLLQQQGVPAPAQQPNIQQQLAQEEAAMRTQVAQQQAQMPAGADLLNVCYRLGTYGHGFPKLVGNAAAAYAAAGGQHFAPGVEFQGIPAPVGAARSLHTLPLSEVSHIYQLEGELAAERAKAMPQMPQAPAQPQYAPVQVPHNAPPIQQQIAAQYNQNIAQAPVSFLAPGTPESMPQLAQIQTPAPAPEGEKKTRGRPKKPQDAAPESVAPPAAQIAAPATQVAPTSTPATQVAPAATSPSQQAIRDAYDRLSTELSAATAHGPVVILINARPSSGASRSLAGYVDYVNAELAKRYSVTADGKPGIQDVRCAPKDSPLAFGGWKGAVREVVKVDPPNVEGECHLDTFMDELNEAVADALRVVAEQKGWRYYRGVR